MRITKDRRKMRRHRRSFQSLEERDGFLAEKFPNLKLGKAGIYRLEHGGKLTVWSHTVLWSEPHES
jgi:hypothetical protein